MDRGAQTTLFDRPEIEILIRCIQAQRVFAVDATRIQVLLQEGLNWGYLLEISRRHGVMPLLFRRLTAFFEAVPEAPMNELRAYHQANNLRQLQLAAELLKLHKQFERHDIFVIPYKGPTLAAGGYGNLALRQAGDLDILISRCDVPKAKKLLTSLGYEPMPWLTATRLTSPQEAAFLRFEREYAFARPDTGIYVELQWGIAPRYFSIPLDVASSRGRLQSISLGGDTVSTFSPEDLLLVLCIHASKHLWERLLWVCDVAEVVNTYRKMNWKALMNRAAAMGSERMLLLGLFLAQDILATDLPNELQYEVRADPEVSKLAGQVRRDLFKEHDQLQGGTFEGSSFHPFHYRMRERRRDRWRYALRTVAEPNRADWVQRPLPERLFPLYYVLKPFRLARKYGQRLFERY